MVPFPSARTPHQPLQPRSIILPGLLGDLDTTRALSTDGLSHTARRTLSVAAFFSGHHLHFSARHLDAPSLGR